MEDFSRKPREKELILELPMVYVTSTQDMGVQVTGNEHNVPPDSMGGGGGGIGGAEVKGFFLSKPSPLI